MKLLIFPALVLTLLIFGCKQKETILSGQVFIVTQGGESIKLGLVEINIYDSIQLSKIIASKKPEINRLSDSLNGVDAVITQKCDSIKLKMDSASNLAMTHIGSSTYFDKYETIDKDWSKCMDTRIELGAVFEELGLANGSAYIKDLPPPFCFSKTDADGKFSTIVPRGKYGIIATASRKVGDTNENYRWLIWKSLNSETGVITLSNDNLYSTHCPECIR